MIVRLRVQLLVLLCIIISFRKTNNDIHIISSINMDNHQSDLLDICGISGEEVRGKANDTSFCSAAHRQAVEFCSQTNINKVTRNIYSTGPSIIHQRYGEIRKYTLSNLKDFATPLLPQCRELTDYMSAIKYGKRVWPNNITDDEALPSVFIPHDCYAPILPPSASKTCNILDQYNHVILHGDSLTRHLRQAMYMSMRGNYTMGFPLQNNHDCICDGQFSEAKHCRAGGSYFDDTTKPSTIKNGNICPGSSFTFGKRANAPFLVRRGKVDPGESINWDVVKCADDDYKGILIVLQGGLHYSSNANTTFESFIQPVVTHEKFQECLNMGKVRLIWLAFTVQSRLLDEAYTTQSREKAAIFNKIIQESFVSVGLTPNEDVIIFDWSQLTTSSQYSDGLHSLSDVNLAKAAQILYLVERWPYY